MAPEGILPGEGLETEGEGFSDARVDGWAEG